MGRYQNTKEYITLDCEFVTQTAAAWCVMIDDEQQWIPKSVSFYMEGNTEIEVQQWFLDKNNINY